MLKDSNTSFAGKEVVVSGSGNVAIYAAEKAMELGAKVIAMSDSNGYVVDNDGIKLDVVKQIKELNVNVLKNTLNVLKVHNIMKVAKVFGLLNAILLFLVQLKMKLILNPQKLL